mmetsp:Transcript_158/g.486  ORF Transcript_158/g.486 Transcript_158/m.486 type:complete len:306 (-) Transcript_158:78-995(-)
MDVPRVHEVQGCVRVGLYWRVHGLLELISAPNVDTDEGFHVRARWSKSSPPVLHRGLMIRSELVDGLVGHVLHIPDVHVEFRVNPREPLRWLFDWYMVPNVALSVVQAAAPEADRVSPWHVARAIVLAHVRAHGGVPALRQGEVEDLILLAVKFRPRGDADGHRGSKVCGDGDFGGQDVQAGAEAGIPAHSRQYVCFARIPVQVLCKGALHSRRPRYGRRPVSVVLHHLRHQALPQFHEHQVARRLVVCPAHELLAPRGVDARHVPGEGAVLVLLRPPRRELRLRVLLQHQPPGAMRRSPAEDGG